MAVSRVSVNTPKNFIPTSQKNIPKYTTPFIGFVKDNTDAAKMNRIRVWIPELSADNEDYWYTINWCSPFAGATGINSTYSQTSFGMWFSPPDIGNQVVVLFINGDPNMGVYVGGLFQQFMNNMVPGIPNSDLNTTSNNKTNNAPATEYNKTDKQTASSSTDPVRPVFKPLSDGLSTQGLSSDPIRGTSTSSGRRASPSNVNGILTQGGNHLVMDDDPDNAYIRFRTKNGTQIMINDTVGNIYMCTRSGNSWMELSDSGIDVYTTRKISMRCAGDFNIHSDANINMFAGKYINMSAIAGFTMSTEQSINAVAGNQFNLQTEGEITVKSSADLYLIGSGDVGLDSGGTLAIRACESMGLTACGTIFNTASLIKLNSGDGPTPGSGYDANVKDISKRGDIEVNQSNGYNTVKTKTIVSRLPTHEPFPGHPYVNESADTVSLNTTTQTRSQIGTSGVTAPTQSTDYSNTTPTSTSTSSTTTNNGENDPTSPNYKNKISNMSRMSDGSIKTTYSDGTTSIDKYDPATGKYYENGSELSPAEMTIRNSLLTKYQNGSMDPSYNPFSIDGSSTNTSKILNSNENTKGVSIFTSATSKSKSSLLGLANIGLSAANVLLSRNTNPKTVPSVQQVTTAAKSVGESWVSPLSGKVVTLYTEDNYGVSINPSSTQIITPKTGTVIWAGDGKVGSLYNGYTSCVVIDHGDGTQTLLSNLNTISVKYNDTVKAKQSIGTVSINKNVHFEIRSEGLPVDPTTYYSSLGTLNNILSIGK